MRLLSQKDLENETTHLENEDLGFQANQDINRSGASTQSNNTAEIHKGSGEY